MIRRIPIFLLIALLFSSVLSSAESGDEGIKALKNRIRAIWGEAPSLQLDVGVPVKCGTPEMVSAFNVMRHRHDVELAEALERPLQQFAFASQHFVIHYDTTGADSIYHFRVDNNPADGVPDYVNRMAEIFEHVWSVEIDSMGYTTPPQDNANGGDSRLDIYAVNLGFGFFGFTVPESISVGHTAFSYIIIENDFAESPTYVNRPLDAIGVTAAHEFFHTVQFGYDAFEFENWNDSDPGNDKPWWLESASTWMEDVVYDNTNDYRGYLPYFYKYMWMGLTTFSPFGDFKAYHPYASCIWPMFMAERYDNLAIIREIWERCGDVEGYNVLPATDDALAVRSSSLDEAFLEFSVWNFHTGPFADTAIYFSEGDSFPPADTTALVANLNMIPYFPINNLPLPPEDLAANIIVIEPNQFSGGVRVEFDGGNLGDESWQVAVVGFRPQTGLWISIPLTPGIWEGTGEWRNWNSYNAVVVIPVVTSVNASADSSHPYAGRLTYADSLFLQRDVGPVRFLSPSAAGRRGDPITPIVRYSNQGQETATFAAHLIITNSLSTDTAYFETIDVESLPINDAVNIEFPQFTPTGINERYILSAISQLDGDQLTRNDTIMIFYQSIGGVGRLLTAYPSPFIIDGNSLLTIPYSYTSADLDTRLYIFDISGARVRQVEMGRHPAGSSTFLGFKWDGKNENGDYVASGVYIYVVNTDGGSQTGKIAVLNRR
ncbi:MAG: hypothetical protein A2W25_02755 [candidate division Zixibacteria bacterium RBG_16_53_22]|nr:MAG: hypothetical protein A2W25_02755 [candidate division Zixibacteria bacterium RBG_16_53_22]